MLGLISPSDAGCTRCFWLEGCACASPLLCGFCVTVPCPERLVPSAEGLTRKWTGTLSCLASRNQTQIRACCSCISMKSGGFRSVTCSKMALSPSLFRQPVWFLKVDSLVPASGLRFLPSLVTAVVSCSEPAGAAWAAGHGDVFLLAALSVGQQLCQGFLSTLLRGVLPFVHVYKPQGKMGAGSGLECRTL